MKDTEDLIKDIKDKDSSVRQSESRLLSELRANTRNSELVKYDQCLFDFVFLLHLHKACPLVALNEG